MLYLFDMMMTIEILFVMLNCCIHVNATCTFYDVFGNKLLKDNDELYLTISNLNLKIYDCCCGTILEIDRLFSVVHNMHDLCICSHRCKNI